MSGNELLSRLNLRYPIIQGPFGGHLSTVQLTSKVSNAGGLGSFGLHYRTPDEMEAIIAGIKQATEHPFAVNLWVSTADGDTRRHDPDLFNQAWEFFAPYFKEYGLTKPEPEETYHPNFDQQIEVILDTSPPVFSFVFGIPDKKILDACRQRQITTVGAATTLTEAEALDGAGVDMIVVSGFEAGGHRPSFMKRAEDSLQGTQSLTRIVSTKIRKPIIAAGGIGDSAGIQASLTLAASAAQLGTAFLACEESGATDQHRTALFSPQARETVLTRGYTGRLARGMVNRLTEEMTTRADDLPPFPIQAWFMSKLRAGAQAAGDDSFTSLYAGQAAPILKHRSVDSLLTDLVSNL